MTAVVTNHEEDLTLPPVSSRVNNAKYTPDTADDGTSHDADSSQFPQSVKPVGASNRHAGCDCGNAAVGTIPLATRRAPKPW